MPRIEYLGNLEARLGALGLPIFYELPGKSTYEPFIVIGINSGVGVPTKTGALIVDDMQQVDIYLPSLDGRVYAERMQHDAVQLVGRSNNVSTQLLKDESIGREVYHIVLRISNYII